jgi:uncharacterized protein
MTAAALGLFTGIAAGVVMARGGICFNSGLRRAAFEGRPAILRAFGFAVALQLLAMPILVGAGLDVTRIGFYPVAQLVGGAVFGAGMALAGGCIAGILWKTGAGSIATAVAIGGFAAGELVIRGPADGVRSTLDDAWPRPADSTVFDLLGSGYALPALLLGAVLAASLAWRSRTGASVGVALGAVALAAWLTAAAADHSYGLGFAGSVDGAVRAIGGGGFGSVPFPAWVAAGLVAGAALTTRGRLRLPDGARARRALLGGLLMGAGATVAHGCNIGHGLTGIPLLSLGSLWATAVMAVAALATWRLLIGPHPAVAGVERPVGGL